MVSPSCRLRASRIANSSEQLEEAVLLDEARVRPLLRVHGRAALTAAFDEKPHEPSANVVVHRTKLPCRVSRPEVVAPPSEHRVEVPDHVPDVLHAGAAPSIGEF